MYNQLSLIGFEFIKVEENQYIGDLYFLRVIEPKKASAFMLHLKKKGLLHYANMSIGEVVRVMRFSKMAHNVPQLNAVGDS